jgi:hypothetical protein
MTSLTSFLYSFLEEGTFVFADSGAYLLSNTIIRVSSTLCPASSGSTPNIYPITEENLARFGITPQESELKTLPDTLIAIPIVFILLTVVSTVV